jgi:hypothetical protein
LAAALRREPGLQVDLIDGSHGELTVLVDGHEVAKKGESGMPSTEEVVRAVKEATHAGAHA